MKKATLFLVIMIMCTTMFTSCFEKTCEHTWTLGDVINEATVEYDGSKEMICTKCEEKTTEKIPKILDTMTAQANTVIEGTHTQSKSYLKNPSSFTVNEEFFIIIYCISLDRYYLVTYTDYSAQNSYGGYQRTSTGATRVWHNYWGSLTEEDWEIADKIEADNEFTYMYRDNLELIYDSRW